MRERYYMGAFWGPREESAEVCARRTARMLEAFSSIHPALGPWYETGWSREEALRDRIDATPAALTERFHAKRMTPLALRLGFALGWWNGADDDVSLGLSISVGGQSVRVYNSVMFDPPNRPEAMPEFFETDTLLAVFSAIIRAWEPEWATLNTSEFLDRMHPVEFYPGPDVGWFTYLCAERLGALPDVLPCAEVVDVVDDPGQGSIFVLTRDHLVSAENPEDVAAGRALVEALDAAGALEPIETVTSE